MPKIIAILVLFFVFCDMRAQENKILIKGLVLQEDSTKIAYSNLYLHELQAISNTNEQGEFEFKNILPGRYHIHVSAPNYEAKTYWVTINNDNNYFYFTLKKTTVELSEIVIESHFSKLGNENQSLSSVHLDKKYLEENRGNNLIQTIENIPGISSISLGVGIAKPIIRGMSFNRVLVNDKGIKQEGQQWGADHGLELDQFDIDRIEIIKGASALMYGSDAMGGVINIYPSIPEGKNYVKGEVVGLYKSNNDLIGASSFVELNKNGYFLKLRYSLQDYGNYRVPTNEFVYGSFALPIYENRLKNTAGNEQNFNLSTGFAKTWGYSTFHVSSYNLKAGLFMGAIGLPRSFLLGHENGHRLIDLPYQDITHNKIINNTLIKIGNNWLEIDLGYQNNIRQEKITPEAFNIRDENFVDYGNLSLGLNLQSFTANTKYNWLIQKNWNLTTGINTQYSLNTHNGFEFLLPNYTNLQYGIFAYNEFKKNENTVFNFGARWDGASYNIEEKIIAVYNRQGNFTGEYSMRNPNINRSFGNFSGAAGVNWKKNKTLNYKLNIGSAYRFPAPNELSVNGIHHGVFRHEIGNANLNPERGVQADFGLVYKKTDIKMEFTPFTSYYDNFIYLSPTGRFSRLNNGGMEWEYKQNSVSFVGAEWMMDYHIVKELHWSIGIEYVYNYNHQTGLNLPFTPPLKITNDIGYHWEWEKKSLKKLSLNFNYTWVNQQTLTDRNEQETDSYHLFNAGLNAVFMIKNQMIKLNIQGRNITNTNYLNHTSRYRLLNIPEQGRNIHFSIQIPFSNKF